MLRFLYFICFISPVIFWPFHVSAQSISVNDRPKIGLVLGGGGAKGLAHVGVLEVLEENRIPVDYIAGTSMGAVIGSLYASGYSAQEIADFAHTMEWQELFTDRTAHSQSTFRRKSEDFGFLTDYKIVFKDGKLALPKGLIQGQNLFLELSNTLIKARSAESFDDLPIPFRAVATDLDTGRAEVMKDGDLATAVFSSMAIPGFIPPVKREGKILIDGGLVNNLPVNLAREMGADIVIVVNVETEPKAAKTIGNFIGVLRQTQSLLTHENTEKQLASLGPSDILIKPSVKGFSIAAFGKSEPLTRLGRQAAEEQIKRLATLRLSENDYHHHVALRTSKPHQPPIIHKVRITQNSKLSDKVIQAGIHQKTGKVFNPEQLNSDIEHLYGSEAFSRITYDVLQEEGQNILHVNARSKESSDGYFRFGLGLDSNLKDESSFTVGISYTRPQLNKWGGEWRSEINIGNNIRAVSEFYQPLGASQQFFIEPSIFLEQSKVDFRNAQNVINGEVKNLWYGSTLEGGMLFDRWGELKIGVTFANVNIDFTNPALNANAADFNNISVEAGFTIDTLDNLSFPRSGEYLVVERRWHDSGLGNPINLKQLDVNLFKPITFGRNTLSISGNLQASSGQDANRLRVATLGGFGSLSGFSEDELSGENAIVFGLTYYRRMNEESAIFDMPIFLGGGLETGNVYQDLSDINTSNLIYAGGILAGIETPLGPTFIGAGYNDTGAFSLYFKVGSIF